MARVALSLEEALAAGETERTCSACEQTKPLVDPDTGESVFKIRRVRGRETLTGQCLVCFKRKKKANYEANRQVNIDRATKWKRDNRERVNAQIRERRKNDPEYRERRRQQNRALYENRLEEMRPYWRERKRAELERDPKRAGELRRYKRNWRRKNLEYRAREAARAQARREFLQRLGIATMGELDEQRLAEAHMHIAQQIEALAEAKLESITKRDERMREIQKAKERVQQLEARSKLTDDERELLELSVPIPASVAATLIIPLLVPYAADDAEPPSREVLNRWRNGRYQDGDRLAGIRAMGTVTQVPERRIWGIFNDAQSVSLEVLDKLLMDSEYTLDDAVDMAREWAMLTGDPWPCSVRGWQAVLRRIRQDLASEPLAA